jgi:hypothetical protein
LRGDPLGLERAFALFRASFACALLASFCDCGSFFSRYGIYACALSWLTRQCSRALRGPAR